MEEAAVHCQICHERMRPRSVSLDLGPAEWRPPGDRLAAILSEVFQCERCGGLTIRPGTVSASSSRAA